MTVEWRVLCITLAALRACSRDSTSCIIPEFNISAVMIYMNIIPAKNRAQILDSLNIRASLISLLLVIIHS